MRRVICAGILPLFLAACGDPLAGIERISDVDLADSDPAASIVPSPAEMQRQGVLDRVLDGPETTTAEAKTGGFWSRLTAPEKVDPGTQPVAEGAAATRQDAPEQGGLFARIFQDGGADEPQAEPDTDVTLASATPIQDTPTTPQADRAGGFLSRLTTPSERKANPYEIDASYGDALPFGTVGRVCDARRKPLGRKIEKTGAGGYTLYDSAPNSTGPRAFYITGFADDCPRQVTAALALLGAPSMYEQLRYGLPAEALPYAETDKAYERVKSRICRVGRRKPCGAAIKQMDRSTVFVTVYERFEGSSRWADLLVSDGELVATALKTTP